MCHPAKKKWNPNFSPFKCSFNVSNRFLGFCTVFYPQIIHNAQKLCNLLEIVIIVIRNSSGSIGCDKAIFQIFDWSQRAWIHLEQKLIVIVWLMKSYEGCHFMGLINVDRSRCFTNKKFECCKKFSDYLWFVFYTLSKYVKFFIVKSTGWSLSLMCCRNLSKYFPLEV